MKNRNVDFPRYFKLYKKAVNDLQYQETIRGTNWGIAARPAKDAYAERWQQIRMRVEILEAVLEGRNPNWFNCYYLPVAEMYRRNRSYELDATKIKETKNN